MPLFMDVHDIDGGVAVGDVAQGPPGPLDLRDPRAATASYLRYWVDEKSGKVFCLVDSPDATHRSQVHREAHGLVAQSIYPRPGRKLVDVSLRHRSPAGG